MYLAVIDVKPMSDHQLLLTFENGEKRLFDVKPYLDKGIFRELRDERAFRAVKVSFDSIAWSHRADLDPEDLYDCSVPYHPNMSDLQDPPQGELTP